MEKEFCTNGDRFKVNLSPRVLDHYPASASAWFETEEAIEAGLTWGEEKARLLKWVRKQMRQRLTPRQQRCIELYYFEGLSFAEVGTEAGITMSSAYRIVQRGIRRLRVAARVDPPVRVRPRPRIRRRRRCVPQASK